jgi:carboxypeptidase Taq
MNVRDDFERLISLRRDIAHFESALALLDWDKATIMPKKGAVARAETVAALTAAAHAKRTDPAYAGLVRDLFDRRDELPAAWQRRAVEVEHREWARASKLPDGFVRELARLTSEAYGIWVDAKRSSDFAGFAPSLARIVEMKREESAIVGPAAVHPYDPLLDEYEPGATVASVGPIFEEVGAFLAPLVAEIVERAVAFDPIPAPRGAQEALVRALAERLGFDFASGCMGVTEHPFMTTIHAGDSRVAVAFKEDDVADGVYSIVHEVGHALYELGLPAEWRGLGIGKATSLGIHESQSRLWENQVGRSRGFACGPLLQELSARGIGFGAADDLYRRLNVVRPSLIRTEADEVTYNLHVALRFDVERRLIEGSLEVGDVRDAWNAGMRELLGIDVPDDARGVLQDVHWSGGWFGYFPTYALGNLYAAQFFATAKSCIPDLDRRIAKGDLRTLLGWLRESVHRQASMYDPPELCRRATGSPLDPAHFFAYIEGKYGELYDL